ncbi:MAG: hypothetical protein IJ410_05980 [Oscillospiraceae bacterium]|nr:hypothetical protein [Oscillospiraceae bacterium]
MEKQEKQKLTDKEQEKQIQEWELTQKEETKPERKLDKEALADYVISKMPGEMLESLYAGKSMGEVMSMWENTRLKKENEELKAKLEQASHKPLTLKSEGGEGEKDPFTLGFMQAMQQY